MMMTMMMVLMLALLLLAVTCGIMTFMVMMKKNGENCFSSEKSHCLYREARAARVAPLIRARASSGFCSPGTKNGFGVILGLC